MCCASGEGYFQVYVGDGSLILDETGIFSTKVSKSFVVGDPKMVSPVSSPPTASVSPSLSQVPITIAVQLDQWSAETGFSLQSLDGNHIFFDWRPGSFVGKQSSLIVETVHLPRDIEVNFILTDTGSDGFCKSYFTHLQWLCVATTHFMPVSKRPTFLSCPCHIQHIQVVYTEKVMSKYLQAKVQKTKIPFSYLKKLNLNHIYQL